MHALRDKVLCGDLDVGLSESLAGIHPVQVDKTKFFEDYESSLQSLSKMTEHQESKLRQLHEKKSKVVNLSAPAGAGKTFVAVQFALDKIYEKWTSQEPILYVAPRPSLGLAFIHWLIERHQWLGFNGGNVNDLLPRIVLTHKPFEKLKFVKLTLDRNRLVEEEVDASKFALAIFDEAHELFTGTRDDNMTGIYKHLQADQKLLLSDKSQSGLPGFTLPDDIEDNVSLDEVVRSTRRIVAAAQAFELVKDEGVTTRCCGTDGPPLKTFIFKALDSAQQMYTKYCDYTKEAIWHVRKAYPGLRSLHCRVAIIVPDDDFCDNLKELLQRELKSTSPTRKLQLKSFEESLRYLRSHDHDERTTESEVLVVDTIEQARGQEMMVAISVGLDEKIAGTDKVDPLLTRARIYQGITRAQLMAIVIDRVVEGGWLQFLTTLKFSNHKFNEKSAFGEVSPKAASSIVKKQEEDGQSTG